MARLRPCGKKEEGRCDKRLGSVAPKVQGLELADEAEVVFVEEADVGDVVADHGDALDAESKGRYFLSHIRNRFPYQKLPRR